MDRILGIFLPSISYHHKKFFGLVDEFPKAVNPELWELGHVQSVRPFYMVHNCSMECS